MSLPKPFYEEPGIVLYCGDCLEILPSLPKVDLVLTDPPYGIGIAANPVRQMHEKSDWDNKAPSEELFKMLRLAGKEQIIWGGNYFPLPPSQGYLVWDKVQPEDFSLAMCEQAWWSRKHPAKLYRLSVLSYRKDHPTQKPEKLMEWCISLADNLQTILDPFCGSGTTLVAAKNLGRKAIGIELEPKYCQIAVDRLRQEVLL